MGLSSSRPTGVFGVPPSALRKDTTDIGAIAINSNAHAWIIIG